MLDSNQRRNVPLEVIYRNYNSSNHPDVAAGSKTVQEIEAKFLDTFGAFARGNTVLISEDEFMQHIREISASFPHDDNAFVRMMECVWGVSEAKDSPDEEISVIEYQLRDKLRLRMRGNETEEQVMLRAFKFIDVDDNGFLGQNEFKQALERLGLIATDDQIVKLFIKYDKDSNGGVNYYEFSRDISSKNDHIFKQSLSNTLYAAPKAGH